MEKVYEIYIRTTPERLVGGDHRTLKYGGSTTSAPG